MQLIIDDEPINVIWNYYYKGNNLYRSRQGAFGPVVQMWSQNSWRVAD